MLSNTRYGPIRGCRCYSMLWQYIWETQMKKAFIWSSRRAKPRDACGDAGNKSKKKKKKVTDKSIS